MVTLGRAESYLDLTNISKWKSARHVPRALITVLPFLLAYEVSCRARTGSVLHKVTLHDRLVIRPVFRIRETGGSPASLALSANDFGRHYLSTSGCYSRRRREATGA